MAKEKRDFHEWLVASGFDPADLEDAQRDTLLKAFEAEGDTLQASGGDPTDRALAGVRRAQQRQEQCGDVISRYAQRCPSHLDVIEATGRVAVAEGWTPERLNLALLRETRSSGVSTIRGGSQPAGRDIPKILRAAMLLHAGRLDANEQKALGPMICERATDLRVHSVMDWCRAACELQGIEAPRGKDELLRAASGPSTYNLPIALGDVAQRSLLDGYAVPVKSWQSWVRSAAVDDFRTHQTIRPFTNRGLDQVAPGGELKHNVITEAGYTHSAGTYGSLISVDRRDIINDDLGVLNEIPRMLGIEGARTVADLIYRILLSNPASFFGVANGNFDDGSDSALSVDALRVAVTAFRKQTDPTGRAIDIAPRVLLVPPELELTARALIKSQTLERSQAAADEAPTANPLADMLAVEVESRLSNTSFTGASTTGWYLFGDPAYVPAGIASWLGGVMSPVIKTVDTPANWLGLSWQAVLDVGFAMADFRSGYKAAGA